MKRVTKKKRKKLLNNIKHNYQECKDALIPEPRYAKVMALFLGVSALMIVVFEIVCLELKNSRLNVVFVVLFFVFIILYFINICIDKKLKKFHKLKMDSMKELCKMAIDDEAKKKGVSREELVIYLMNTHRVPGVIRGLANAISIFATATAVYYLPGYQVQHGIIIFSALVLANILISFTASFLIKKLYELDDFEFYIIKPYEDMINSIDSKD